MRILYDHQVFQEQTVGGISRYIMELFRNAGGFEAEIAIAYSDNRYLLSEPSLQRTVQPFGNQLKQFLWGLNFRGKGRIFDGTKRVFTHLDRRRSNLDNSRSRISDSVYDVFHPTYYDPYFMDVIGDRPFVLTVFDMIHEIFPEHFPLDDRTSVHKRILCEKAERIIAISLSTKMDLIRYFKVDSEKIDVVHLATSMGNGEPNHMSPRELPERFLLFTGNRGAYKNFFFFARAIVDILLEDDSLMLVCTGPAFSGVEKDFISNIGITGRVLHFSASDEEMARLYAGAEAFVFPSLYEGFGMTVLEAFACGCPAVVSDTPALREIAGDAAVFFDPKSMASTQQATRRVLYDRELQSSLIQRGHERNGLFSWQKTADETMNVYRKVIGSSR